MTQMSETFGRDFWDDAAVRAIKTTAQALLSAVAVAGVGTAAGLGAVAWPAALSIAALAGIIAILTAIAGAQAKSVAPDAVPRRALSDDGEPVAVSEAEPADADHR